MSSNNCDFYLTTLSNNYNNKNYVIYRSTDLWNADNPDAGNVSQLVSDSPRRLDYFPRRRHVSAPTKTKIIVKCVTDYLLNAKPPKILRHDNAGLQIVPNSCF